MESLGLVWFIPKEAGSSVGLRESLTCMAADVRGDFLSLDMIALNMIALDMNRRRMVSLGTLLCNFLDLSIPRGVQSYLMFF